MTASRDGMVWLTSASVEVQNGVSPRPEIGGTTTAGAGRDQAAVERQLALAAVVQEHGKPSGAPEARLAVQHGDGRCALQDVLVLGLPQFVDTGLLLCQQPATVDDGARRGYASVERALAPQVRNMGGADHDLRWHATDVDARAADGAAFDQCDPRPKLDRLQRRRHRSTAAADDSDVQLTSPACGLGAASQARRLVEHACALAGGRRIGKRRAVTE